MTLLGHEGNFPLSTGLALWLLVSRPLKLVASTNALESIDVSQRARAVACPSWLVEQMPSITFSSFEDFYGVDECYYKVMCLLETNPEMSQRDIARELGVSLGKVNYCLRALAEKGWIKVTNFKNSQNKAAYMYLLTRSGFEERASLAVRFLRAKMEEYEALRTQIREMRHVVGLKQPRRIPRRVRDR